MANRLREIRVIPRISQYVLSLKTGIPQSKISLFENNLLKPKMKEKKKLARALGVSLQQLFPEEKSGG